MWKSLSEKYDIRYTFLDIDDDLLHKLEDDIRKRGDEVYRTSNVKADMTDWKTELKSFFKLESEISKKINKEIVYDNHWGLIYRDGDHAIPHSHGTETQKILDGESPPDMSFIFYIKTPEGSGILHFIEEDIYVEPEKNMLIVFDSRVMHQVFPNTVSGIERVATAVNIFFLVDNVQEIR